MKRLLCMTVLLMSLLACLSVHAVDYNELRRADKISLSENEIICFDFDDEDYDPEDDDWYVLGGKWVIEDGCLKQVRNFTGYNDKQMNYYGKVFGDFTARMRFKVTEVTEAMQGWCALAFRRTQYDHEHEESGYIITVEGPKTNGKAVLCDWTKSLSYEEYAEEIDVSDFVDMVVVAKGDTYTFYFNDAIETGEYNFRITDDSWTEPGFIGICAGNSLIEVDYLYIYTGDKQVGIVADATGLQENVLVRNIQMLGKHKNYYALGAAAISFCALVLSATGLVKGGKKREK